MEHRDKAVALRFLQQAIRQNGLPETITSEGSEANAAAIKNDNEEHGTTINNRGSSQRSCTGGRFHYDPILH